MHTSIDGLLADVDRKYGFTPPLAEFIMSDIYQDIRRKAQNVSYLGEGKIAGGFLGLGGTACYRVALSGRFADAELWIDSSDLLPRKLIVTVKSRPGNPQINEEFSGWKLTARVSKQDFAFVPPQGAVKVPMRMVAEINTRSKKASTPN